MAQPTTSRIRRIPPELLMIPLLVVAALIRIAAIIQKGVTYNSYIDAREFVSCARSLATNGAYVFYGNNPSAHELPAFPTFLAIVFRLTHDAYLQHFAMKALFLAMSLASIWVLYLIGRRMGGIWVGLLAAAMLALSMPNIYTGLLALSETPFLLELLLLTLLTFRLAEKPGWRRLVPLVALFVVSLYTRQAALAVLPAAALYLLLKRYPRQLLVRQMVVTVLVTAVAFTPWWIRNYQAFGAFVPFQNMGAETMYEGTFQVFAPTPPEAGQAVSRIVDGFTGSEYELTQVFKQTTKDRLMRRWRDDPVGLAFTYLVRKPAAAWLLPHYWDEVLIAGSSWWVVRIHAISTAIGLLALGWLGLTSPRREEYVFMGVCVLVITAGTIVYLGLHKYVYPFIPFLYVATAQVLVDLSARLRQSVAGAPVGALVSAAA